MKRLCIIGARGGSKGLKNKNIKILLGKPLIAHSIDQAKRSKLFEYISVSSDSDEILNVSKEWGADFIIKRPEEMASDTASKVPVMRHCMLETEKMCHIKFDTVVDLDCTSPLRFPEDIIESVKLLEETGVKNVVTGAPSRKSPYFNMLEINENGTAVLSKKIETTVYRRQDSPKTYDMNASVYAWKRDVLAEENTIFLEDTKLYVMPEERSLDIDNQLDFEIVELLANKRGYL